MTQGKSSVKNASGRKKIVLEKPRDNKCHQTQRRGFEEKNVLWIVLQRDLRT